MNKTTIGSIVITLLIVLYFLLSLFTNFASTSLPPFLDKRPYMIWIIILILIATIVGLSMFEKKIKGSKYILHKPTKNKPDGEAMKSKQYDVFISYSHKDKNWVDNALLPQLLNHGFKVLIDDNFSGGAFTLQEIENSVKFSNRVLAVLTPDYFKDEWLTLQNAMARTLDPAAHRRKLVPVILKTIAGNQMPLHLAMLETRDLRDDNVLEWNRLMQDLM